MKNHLLLTILLLMSISFSCNSTKDTANSAQNNTALEGQVWQLEKWVSNDKIKEAKTLEAISLLFTDKAKQLNGSDGCNNFFANYRVEDKILIIEISGGTKKYCGEESAKDEQYFKTFLSSRPMYKIHKGNLILETKSDIITFNPQK